MSPSVGAWLLCGLQIAVLLGAALLASPAAPALEGEGRARPSPSPAAAVSSRAAVRQPARQEMTLIPAGSYQPFFKGKLENASIPSAAFLLDSSPVSRGAYLDFVREEPEWRRSAIKSLFAEKSYLSDWRSELDPGDLDEPVVFVSWFAARAYCRFRGGRLPTVVEWERAASLEQSDADSARALAQGPAAGSAPFVFAMAGLRALRPARSLSFDAIWEWTIDFNSTPVSAGPSGDKAGSSLFCGDGFRSSDARNYAAFLRYSFRSSLKASYALKNLGFRCAADVP